MRILFFVRVKYTNLRIIHKKRAAIICGTLITQNTLYELTIGGDCNYPYFGILHYNVRFGDSYLYNRVPVYILLLVAVAHVDKPVVVQVDNTPMVLVV